VMDDVRELAGGDGPGVGVSGEVSADVSWCQKSGHFLVSLHWN
jgi:hypothetical protein